MTYFVQHFTFIFLFFLKKFLAHIKSGMRYNCCMHVLSFFSCSKPITKRPFHESTLNLAFLIHAKAQAWQLTPDWYEGLLEGHAELEWGI